MMGQMSTIVMGLADTLMVGHYGTNELAAAGFVNNILGLLVIGGFMTIAIMLIVRFWHGS